MNKAKGSTVIIQQGTCPLEKKEYVIQLKAGEELVHRAEHIAVGQLFLIFGELVTLAFLLCDFGQKVGEQRVLLL